MISSVAALFACVTSNSAISRASLRTPALIFLIAPEIGDTILCFLFWYLLWTQQNGIAHHVSLLSLKTCRKWQPTNLKQDLRFSKNFPLVSICILFVITTVTFDMLKLYSRIYQGPPGAPKSYLGNMFQELRRGLFLDDRSSLQWIEMNKFEVAITAIYLIFTCYLKIVKSLAILLTLGGICTAYKNSLNLAKFTGQVSSQEKAIQAFQAFQEFLQSINQIIGPLVFGMGILCGPTFMIANISTIFVRWDLSSPINWLTMAIYYVFFFLGAEVSNETDEFREWILNKGQGPYESQLFSVFVDLTQSPLGIQGMECFTMTNGFMAQTMGAVVNFAIILLQFTQ